MTTAQKIEKLVKLLGVTFIIVVGFVLTYKALTTGANFTL